MRYGCFPQNPLEWAAAVGGKIPFPILDTIVPLIQARALMTAGICGVFGALARKEQTAEQLAQALSLDSVTLELMLRVLEAMRYVKQQHGVWELGWLGRKFFAPTAQEPYHGFLAYGPPQARFIDHMEAVLRTGQGVHFHDHQAAHEWDAYQQAMWENARSFAPFVVKHTPVAKGATSCLDIAGSHGLVGGLLAQKHAPMRAQVLDRAEALRTARDLGASETWHKQVHFQEGDLLKDDFGSATHDVIFLCNILHHFDATTNARILERAAKALKPGGSIAIFDIERPAPDSPPDAAGDCFALYFRITSTSACFYAHDYVRWLRSVGLQARVVRSVQLPSRMLVLGTKS